MILDFIVFFHQHITMLVSANMVINNVLDVLKKLHFF